MLSCTLGDKTYTVDYVRAIALREIEKPLQIIARAQTPEQGDPGDLAKDLDCLVNWFCLVFGGQFKASDVYELYPADRLTHDMILAVLAVQQHMTQALSAFPTRAAGAEKDGTENG